VVDPRGGVSRDRVAPRGWRHVTGGLAARSRIKPRRGDGSAAGDPRLFAVGG